MLMRTSVIASSRSATNKVSILPLIGYRRRRLAAVAVTATTTATRSLSSPAAATTFVEYNNHDESTTKTTTTTTKDGFTTPTWQTKYPHVFQSLELGNTGVRLPNRVLMGSMHSGLEGHSMPKIMAKFISKDDDDHDLSRMAAYFRERALGGVGLMVTGGIAPSVQGWTGPFSSQLTCEDEMIQHKVVTNAVHSVQVPVYADGSTEPARICLQILHTGRYAYHPMAVSASSTKSPISPFKATGLSVRDVQKTISDFVNTSVLAQQAGYDGVEIMGSEGYLISQFLSPRTNLRTDEYGGSLENRAKLPLEIVKQVRAATGSNFIIIFRLSLLDLVQDGLQFDESVALALKLQDAGVTVINTGIGWHEARVPTIATSVPRAAFAFTTKQLRVSAGPELYVPLVATNRINHPATAERVLTNNYEGADMISMARPFLADPYLLQKSATGREQEINTCIGCNQACLDHVFVGKIASCLVNPRACHETELIPHELPVKQQLNVSVVGAGPAGCAFAIASAQMGHTVTLYDKDNVIGGQFNMAKRVPGKEEFYETLRYFQTMLLEKYSHKITVKLSTEVTYDSMKKDTITDKWIIATGVDPRDPKIPGQDHPSVLSYIDVLKHKKPVGKRVAVIGAGGIGFDVSEFLLHHPNDAPDITSANDVNIEDFWSAWGIDPGMKNRGGLADPSKIHQPHPQRSIYLLQRKKGKLGAGLGKTTGWIHRATLNNSGAVEMINGVKYEKIDENGNLHISLKDGTIKRVLEVDNIVICAGQLEKKELAVAAQQDEILKNKVYTVGGAYAAGELDAKRAIDMGTRLAYKLHEPSVQPGKHVFKSKPSVEEKFFHMVRRFI